MCILSSLAYGQMNKVTLHDFLSDKTDGNMFSMYMDTPETWVYDRAENILDSISIYGEAYVKRLDMDTIHPHDRLYNTNRILMNYSLGTVLSMWMLELDKAEEFADSILHFYDKYVPLVDDSLFHYRLYSQFEKAPWTAYANLATVSMSKGDFDLADLYILKARESLDLLILLKLYRPFFELNTNLAATWINTARGNCSKSLGLARGSYDMSKKGTFFSKEERDKLNDEDADLVKKEELTNLEQSLYVYLSACDCMVDSLRRVDKWDEAQVFLEDNKIYYEEYHEIIKTKSRMFPGYELTYNANNIFNTYYIHTEKFDKALEHLSVFKNLSDESGSKLTIENDRIRILSNIQPEQALRQSEIFLESFKSYEDKGIIYGYTAVNTPVYDIRGDIYINLFKERESIEYLDSALINYIRAVKGADYLKEGQINMDAYKLVESNLESIYNKISYCYWKKYLLDDNDEFLGNSIRYSDYSKDYLIHNTNASVFEMRHWNTEYEFITEREKTLQGKIYFFRSQLGQMRNDAVNYTDSLLHYTQLSHQFKEEIKQEYPEYFKVKYSIQDISISDVQGGLDQETAILDYVVLEERTLLYLITQDDVSIIELPRKREWIDLIGEINSSLREGGTKKYKKYAPELYRMLLKDVLGILPDEINRLVIIPDDELNDLFFDALPMNRNGKKYVLEQYAISYQYSLNSWLSKEKDQVRNLNDSQFIAFVLDDDKSSPPNNRMGCANTSLKYAKETTLEIANLFKQSEIQSDLNDNEALDKMREADIIHFAIHGCVGDIDNPLNYHLQLASNSSEETEIDMSEIYRTELDAELVVISSCESGLGQLRRGSGLHSIARAFHYAGCPNTIATTAIVNEASTSTIIKSFYEYMLKGHPIDVALQKSKLDFIKGNPEADPYEWSNIILIGASAKMN